MHRCQNSLKNSFKSMSWYISFQEISFAGKPQVVSRYSLSNLCIGFCQTCKTSFKGGRMHRQNAVNSVEPSAGSL